MKKILTLLLACALLLGSLSLFTGCGARVKYEDSDTYKMGPMNTSTKEITSVEIYWTSGEVDVRGVLLSQIGTSGVTVWEDYTATDKNTLRTRLKDGVLQIYPADSGAKIENIPKKHLTVDLPLDLAYSIENISVTVIGDTKVTLDKVRPARLTVNAERGDVTLTGDPGDAKITTTSGNLRLTSGAPTDKSYTSFSFTSETGNATLSHASYGFTAKMENTAGKFETDYDVKASGSMYVYGSQKSTFMFNTAGVVTLKKQETAQ